MPHSPDADTPRPRKPADPPSPLPRRRDVLKLAGVGAAAASGAAVLARAEETPEEQVEGRYQVTPHVARFYQLNRL